MKRALSRTILPLLVVFGLVAGSFSAPPARAEEPAPSGPTEPAPAGPSDEEAGPKELPELRTRFSQTFDTGVEGRRYTDVFTRPVHYRDGDVWRPIDTTLVKDGDGVYSDQANRSDLRLKVAGDAAGLTRFVLAAGVSVGWSLRGARPVQGEPAGASMKYAAIAPHTDLEVTSLPSGVKEDIILNSPRAPRSFVFPLNLQGLTARLTRAGDVVFEDAAGKVRAVMPKGWMKDAAADSPGETPALSEGVRYELLEGNSAVRVTLVDEAWLDDPSRVYPVTVDPTVHTVSHGTFTDDIGDTYISSGAPNTSFYNEKNLKIGLDGGSKHATFIKFDLSRFADTVGKADEIIEADLRMFNWNSGKCASEVVTTHQIRRVTQPHNITNVVWGPSSDPDRYRPESTFLKSSTEAHGREPVCANAYISYPLTTLTRDWFANPQNNHGVEVRSSDNIDPNYFKSFASALNDEQDTNCKCYPRLRMTYNYRPNPPDRLTVSPTNSTNFVTTRNPSFAARYSDRDGDAGVLHFELDGDGRQYEVVPTPKPADCSDATTPCPEVASGTTVTWAPSWGASSPVLTRDGRHTLEVRAHDGRLDSGPAWSLKTFEVDTKRPLAPPSVTASYEKGQAPANVTMTWAAAQDQPATSTQSGSGVLKYGFHFSPTSAPDPSADELHSDLANLSVTRQLPYGTYWFHVRAQDAAGWWGDYARFGPFSVDRAPHMPELVSPENDAKLASRQPVFEAIHRDPDQDHGRVDFQLRDAKGKPVDADPSTEVVDEWLSDDAMVASGGSAQEPWPYPLEDGRYSWVARAFDGHLYSPEMPDADARKFVIGADPAAVITKMVVGEDGTTTEAGSLPIQVAQGDAVRFRMAITNPTNAEIKLDEVVDNMPPGFAVTPGARAVEFDADTDQEATCATTAEASVEASDTTCDAVEDSTDESVGVTIRDFRLPPNATRTIDVYAVAAIRKGGRFCEPLDNTAKAVSYSGNETQSLPVRVTVCDVGLGLEKWWQTLSHSAGSQETASVNVGNGNLVVQATDSTPVQGHGRMAHVLRRTYNSQATTVATLPGSIGAGWQLNVAQADDLVGAGVGATNLVVPSFETVTRPGAVTVVDRDGTRHAFTLRDASLSIDVATVSQAGTRAALTPRNPNLAEGKLCIDASYKAPPGVDLSLWRYVRVDPSVACPGSRPVAYEHPPTAVADEVVGFVAMRPDRLRYEFGADGRLLSMIDGAGVEMRYVYDTLDIPVDSPVGTKPQHRLRAVYEQATCTGNQSSAAEVRTNSCRATTFEYSAGSTNAVGTTVSTVTAEDPAGRTTVYHLESTLLDPKQRLVQVDNPDGTAVQYGYTNCSSSSAQLCSITDPKGKQTRFEYFTSDLLPAKVRYVWDRTASAETDSSRQDDMRQVFEYSAADRLVPPTTVVKQGDGSEQANNDRVTQFKDIDARARVAVVEVGAEGAAPTTRTQLTWETKDASCTSQGDDDNNLCRQVIEARNGGTTPDSETSWMYKPEGGVQSVTRENGDADATTTFGYRTQFIGHAQATSTEDTLGNGTVKDGSRADAATALYVLSDRIASLTPRGNAAADPAPYLTTFQVDADATKAPNSSGDAGTCGSSTASNTGLVCGQTEPAFEGTGRRTTSFTYDEFGQRLTLLTPKAAAEGGSPIRYSYYGSAAKPLGGTTPAEGWLKSVTDPDGNFVVFAYDAAGNVVRTWDRNATKGQSVDAFPADAGGASYSETRYAPGESSAAFAKPWRYVHYERDPGGNVTTHKVDKNGNVVATTPPRGTATRQTDHDTSVATDYDTTAEYDANDRLTLRRTPLAPAGTRFRYDTFGNKTSTVDALNNATVFKYDSVGRLTDRQWARTNDASQAPPVGCSTRAPAGHAHFQEGAYICTESFTYDGVGNQKSATDAADQKTLSTFDALGRETRRDVPRRTVKGTDGAPDTTEYVRTDVLYDPDGNVTDVCPPREFTEGAKACTSSADHASRHFSTHVDYDYAGAVQTVTRYRRETATSTKSLVDKTTYDLDGNVATSTNARQKTTEFDYDLLGRKTSMITPRAQATTNWHYDAVGNTTAVVGPDPDALTATDDRITAYSYDDNNRLRDVVVGATHLNADQAGVATGSANRRTRRDYDEHGNVIAVWGPRAFTQSTRAPDRDPATQDADSDFVVRTTYDVEDRPTHQYVPRQRVAAGVSPDQCLTNAEGYHPDTVVCRTKAEYDAVGNRTKVILPTSDGSDGRFITWSYTDDYLVAAVKAPDPAGGIDAVTATQYFYDANARPLRVRRPLPAHENQDGTKELRWAEDAYQWTLDGLLTKETRQDDNAEPGSSGDLAHVTTFDYDAAGNRTTQTQTVGTEPRVTARKYTSDGLLASLTEPGDRLTSYTYTETGQPKTVYSPVANERLAANQVASPTTHTYTDDDLPLTITTPVVHGSKFRRTTYSYDAAGRKTAQQIQVLAEDTSSATVLENGGTQKFEWLPTDAMSKEFGRNHTSTVPEVIATEYDAAGNPKEIDQTTGDATSAISVDYYFDDLTRSVNDGTTTSSYQYDGAGQIVVRDNGGDETSYVYNDAGLPTKATAERSGNTRTWQWTYDKQGRKATETQPDGRDAAWTWNADNTLNTYVVNDTDNTVASKWTYEYDELYRITSSTVAGKEAGGQAADTSVRRYRYDVGGRVDCYTIDTPLTDCSTSTSDDVTLGEWDANNNRRQWGKQEFEYNADDTIARATDKAGTNWKASTYHAFGGLQDDNCAKYTYDGFDRMASVGPSPSATEPRCSQAAAVTYEYDGLDRQTRKSVAAFGRETKFTYDGLTQQTVKQVDTGAEDKPRNFTLGADGAPKAITGGAAGSETTEFLQTDGQGNIATTLKEGSGIGCTVRYDPFGTPEKAPDTGNGVCNTGTTDNDLFYRSARRDNTTGSYQFGSRTYDPNKAAFLTPDSYRAGAPTQDLSVGVDPLTRNRYSYVNGDPVNLVDPDGHAPCYEGDSPHPSCKDRPAKPYRESEESDGGQGSHDGGGYYSGVSQQDECCTERPKSSAPEGGTSRAAGERASWESWELNGPEIALQISANVAQGTEPLTPEDTRNFYLTIGIGGAVAAAPWAAISLSPEVVGAGGTAATVGSPVARWVTNSAGVTTDRLNPSGQLPVPRDLVPAGMVLNTWGNRVWGVQAEGAKSLIGARSAEQLRELGLTVQAAQRWQDFYANHLVTNPQNAAAAARVELMDDIIRTLGGKT